MCRISEELWNESRAEGLIKGQAKTVKALMEAMKLSFLQACDMLKIPENERSAMEKIIQQ